ncbi:MAG: winged helix-turn-helix transcriptional regulator, partial [Desulfobacterales bacterium]|nr:winged helix-turn-helix transcriptional regulator [Desulfobacterales bacterium]
MDIHDLRTLRLLEAIDRQRSPSQRDLAKTLDVSLGLVNSFVRRLAQKGYFKITHLPRNRIGYILTPKGAAEKTRLTYAYIRLSYRFYRDARRKISELYQALEAANNRQIVFFGTGDLAEIAFMSLRETTI